MSKVPAGWIKAPVEFFGDVCAGRQRAPSFTQGFLRPYLRVANVFDGYINTSDVNKMYFTDKEFERFKLEIGDILLNEGQSIELVGRPAMYLGEPVNCCFQNTLVRFKHNSLSDPFYAIQRFRMCLYDGTFQAISKKTTSIAHLGVSRFANLELLWPPLPEQTKIAQILSTWDKAIATTEKLIGNSQQQKKALMQSLLTGKKRLPGFEGEWVYSVLSDVTIIKKGKALSSRDLKQGLYPVIAGGKSSPYSHADFTHENVITVSASGAYAGYVAFYKYKIWASDCSVIQAKKNIAIEFIFQFLLLKQNEIYSLQSGGAQPHIYPKDLEALSVNVPPLPEQQKIAAVLTAADNEIELLQKKLAFLKQEKAALMQQLLTGKRRVKVEAA